jgi:hypothetical protein
MKTQSHAAGEFVGGSVHVQLYLEAIDGAALSQAELDLEKFKAQLQHCLVGQLSAQTELKLSVAGTPASAALLSGGALVTSAATWESTGASAGVLLPYGRVMAPGTLG